MPMRTFLCESCGLLFDRLVRGETISIVCKRCSQEARILLTGSNTLVSSAHRPDGPAPQNTGASLVDHDVDWVIARDAAWKLREMEARQDYKRRVLYENSVSGFHLSRLDTGEYFVMTDEERIAAKEARLLHQDAIQEVNKIRRGAKEP